MCSMVNHFKISTGLGLTLLLSTLPFSVSAQSRSFTYEQDRRDQQQADEFKADLKTGAEFTQGHYGDAEVLYKDWVYPVKLSVYNDNLYFAATMSWVKSISSRDSSGERDHFTGWDDLGTEFSYSFTLDDVTYLDLDAELTIPTADPGDGIGSGVFSYYLGTTLTHEFEIGYAAGSFGYDIGGDQIAPDFPAQPAVSLEAGYDVNDNLTIGAIHDWQQIHGDSPVSETTLFLDYNLNQDFSVYAYGLKGYTTSSPANGTGMTLRYRF